MPSNKVYGARHIFSLVSQAMIAVYLLAVAALVLWAAHFFNVRDDAMLEDLATTKRKTEQRKAAEERRMSASEITSVTPVVETRNDSPSLLREAEIKQQKELERARALPKNNRGSLPLKREPTVPPVKDAASGLVEGKSPVATTSTVENVEEKPDQLEDADAEKKPIPSI